MKIIREMIILYISLLRTMDHSQEAKNQHYELSHEEYTINRKKIEGDMIALKGMHLNQENAYTGHQQHYSLYKLTSVLLSCDAPERH